MFENLQNSFNAFEIELTHCDEMDRVSEFEKEFDKVNIYDSPLV